MEGYNPLTTSEFPERLNEGGRDLRTEGHYTSSSQEHDGVPEEKTVDLPPLSLRETAEIGFTFCWLWFIANWAINAALNYTTVTSSAIIASTSGFFTLGLGKIFGVERFTMMKMAAVITCFSGVILVSFSDLQPDSQFSTTTTGPSFSSYLRLHSYSPDISVKQARPLFGDALALLSALFYAFYVIFLKVKVQDESRIDMRLFLGFVGLFDLITCWPVGVVLHKIGVEKFELPATTTQWYALLTNMVILVLSDYLYVLAMLKTTPLLVTVGISLTIPVAVLGDFILNSPTRGQVLAGASLPKERRSRIGTHKPSVKLHKRAFAVQENAVEHVDIGAAAEASGNEILASLESSSGLQELSKKEKQALKREAFLHKLGALKTPYSKSHTRREKRKAKEQLAGGGLNEIQAILSTITVDEDEADVAGFSSEGTSRGKDSNSMETDQRQEKTRRNSEHKVRKIGEGKSAPLSQKQRKRILQAEQFRQPFIRSNSEYAKNPFATIRTHAQNTLIKH
ncbi:hypothetical protein AN958_04925 [Leucoagaricus sp. SymC.cos]|nr:hypothetical protein AN958_04925 [Leucoagaricus sp. SymC.cos]